MITRLIPFGLLLALAPVTGADEPGWWADRGVKTSAPASNQSPATVGQAKHMAAMALRELQLRGRFPAAQLAELQTAVAAVVDLEVPVPPPGYNPVAPPPGYIGPNNHVLLVGELKALARPFYDHLRQWNSVWLDNEMITAKIRVVEPGSNPSAYSPYPWSVNASDDENTAIASLGQLKAVFSLRLEMVPAYDSDGDVDGDGIPNRVDPNPLVSALAFPDADGDGIPDTQDAEPETARGQPPAFVSETSPGYPLSNLLEGVTVKFVFTVSNPDGPVPTASDLTLLLNGTEKSAEIAALGSASGTSQRFLLTWTATTPVNYPELTIQNLVLRFRDAQNATSWLKLARIDVAEWEGMIAGSRAGPPSNGWEARVQSHSGGLKSPVSYLAGQHGGSSVWYRGPRNVKIMTDTGAPLSAMIGHGIAYPMFFFSKQGSGPLHLRMVADVSNGTTIPYLGTWAFNDWKESIRISSSAFDREVAPAGNLHQALPEKTQTGDPHVYVRIDRHAQDGWRIISGSNWPIGIAQGSARRMTTINLHSDSQGNATFTAVDCEMAVNSKIVPHAPGTIEHPGLPLPVEAHTNSNGRALFPISPGACHKIVLKTGPDAAAISNGIGLWLRKGVNGESPPQTGFTLKVMGDNQDLENLTVPADGRITVAPGSPNWNRLTGTEGLTLFMSLDKDINEIHDLSLQLLKMHEWYPEVAVKTSSITVLPVDLDVNGDGDLSAPCDGLNTYLPGYELDQAKLHTGNSFKDAQYAGPQAMNIVMPLPADTVDQAAVRIVATTERFGYCGNGAIPNDSPILPYKDFTLTGQETVVSIQEATVPVMNQKMIIPIHCHDYGGWCELEITLMKNGAPVGSPFILILPRDDNGDKLADHWQRGEVVKWNEQFNLNQGNSDWADPNDLFTWGKVFGPANGLLEDQDRELADSDGATGPMPVMADKGDGLTAQEECRGFILDGGPGLNSTKHRRLHAARKEALFQLLIMPQITAGSNPGNCANAAAQAFDAAQRFETVQGFYNAEIQNDGADLDCYMVEKPLVPDANAMVAYQDGTTRSAYLPNTTLKPISGSTRPPNALTYVYYDQRLHDENPAQHASLYSPDLTTARDHAFMRARDAAETMTRRLELEHFAVCAFYNRFGLYSNAANWSLGVIERDPTSSSNHLAGGNPSNPMTDPEPWMRGCQFAVNAISEQYPSAPAVQDFNGVMEYALAHEIGHTLIWARDAGHPGSLPGLMASPQQGEVTPSSLSQVQIQNYEVSLFDLRNRASAR